MKKAINKKSKRKFLKAIAFSEMFVMIFASFAFAFIMSTGIVSAAVTFTKIGNGIISGSDGKVYYQEKAGIWKQQVGEAKDATRDIDAPTSLIVTFEEINDPNPTTSSTNNVGITLTKIGNGIISGSDGKVYYQEKAGIWKQQVGEAKDATRDIQLTDSGLISKLEKNNNVASNPSTVMNTPVSSPTGVKATLTTATLTPTSKTINLQGTYNIAARPEVNFPGLSGATQIRTTYVNGEKKYEFLNANGEVIKDSNGNSDWYFTEEELANQGFDVKDFQNGYDFSNAQSTTITLSDGTTTTANTLLDNTGKTIGATALSADGTKLYKYNDAKKTWDLNSVKDTAGAWTSISAITSDATEYTLIPGLWKETLGGWGHLGGNLMEGIWWSGAVIAGIKIFQEIGLIPDEYAQPLYASLGAGIMVGKTVNGLLKSLVSTGNLGGPGAGKIESFIATHSTAISFVTGAITAYLIFAYNYKKEKEKTETLTFKCMSWQAPSGGEKCSQCNDDPSKPCSEYRCKALGQACELLNKGTGQEKCEWVNRNDAISPGIKPWTAVLTSGYTYSQVKPRPAGGGSATSGMVIERTTENTNGNKCIDPYTPIEFGILTYNQNDQPEPAQCKIEYQHTASFSEMGYYFGDRNLYLTNHSQRLSMPSISSLTTIGENESEGIEMEQTPGEYTFYVRCADANGNDNVDEFAVRFCIDEGPDMTAPIIKGTNFGNQTTPVQFGQDNLSIEVYTNEPAKCFWEREDRDIAYMANEMSCSNNVLDMNSELLYTCTTTLTSIEDRKNNEFFFRCEDLSENKNSMQEGYQFVVIGTQKLDIVSFSPNGTIAGSTSTIETTLHVETANGYDNGESRCFYSSTEEDSSYIEFFYNTSEFTNVHDQILDLGSGTYTYYFKCIDLGGNSAENSTSFTLNMDRESPMVIRAYNENNQLLVITDESSDCRYNTQSCSFNFNDGLTMSNANSTTHETGWEEKNYYIKCADSYNNQPDPAECSIVVRPYLG